MEERQWHYVNTANERVGPVTEAEIRRLAEQRTIGGTTLVWHGKMSQWQPLSTALATAASSQAAQPPSPNLLTKMFTDSRSQSAVGKAPAKKSRGSGLAWPVVLVLLLAGAAVAAHRFYGFGLTIGAPTQNSLPQPQSPGHASGKPGELTLEEKMAVAEQFLVEMETKIPPITARIYACGSNPEEMAKCTREVNEIMSRDPFNKLKFPCIQLIKVNGETDRYRAYLDWFDQYEKRQRAVTDQLAAATRNSPRAVHGRR